MLSSPKNSKGNALEAVANIDVPAFFAVSSNDPGGNFYNEVKPLYDACTSEQKEFHLLTSYEHGTDLLSDEDVYSRKIGSTEEQKQERRQLADDLMRFVIDAFGDNEVITEPTEEPDNDVNISETSPAPSSGETDSPTPTTESSNVPDENNGHMLLYALSGGFAVLILIIVMVVKKCKR